MSQRTAATALGISQALLSHYENGIREPGLPFVVRACDYYGVSADFLLGRTLSRDGTTIAPEELYDLSDEKDNSLRGGVLALLSKKLLVNSIGVLFDPATVSYMDFSFSHMLSEVMDIFLPEFYALPS